MQSGTAILLVALLAILILALYRLALVVPRLRVDASLRGTTRAGTLLIAVHNLGRWRGKRVRLTVAWERGRERSEIESRELGELPGASAESFVVGQLHRALADGGGWEAIVIEVSAQNALPRRARIALAQSGRAAGAGEGAGAPSAPAVEYRKEGDAPCPLSSDKQHAWEDQYVLNDGVREHWRVCRRCRFVTRLPLSDADRETQARVRREKFERERRLDEERARRGGAGTAPPRPSSRSTEATGDRMPVDVALWILGIDEAAPESATIEAAYRRLAKQYHPDRAAGVDAKTRALLEERMRDLNRARDRLREHFSD